MRTVCVLGALSLLLLSAVSAQATCGVRTASAGGGHVLVIRDDGSVWGWGSNGSYQLDGSGVLISPSPLHLAALDGTTTLVAAGGSYSLALQSDGTLLAWGWAGNGRTGTGAMSGSVTSPTAVIGLSGVIGIAAGQSHSLAVKGDGSVWAWGYNRRGQLGNGTSGLGTDSAVPVQVSGLTNAVAVAVGGEFSLALKDDGSVWAWGRGAFGQLGNGSTMSSSVPVQVIGLSDAQAIAAGYYNALASRNDGSVVAWGYGYYGELGNGTTGSSSVPVPVFGLAAIRSVASYLYHCVAVDTSGATWTWGRNSEGQLGLGMNTNQNSPVRVPGITTAQRAVAGEHSTVVLLSDGSLRCFGANDRGQLGDGSLGYETLPRVVTGLPPAAACAAGDALSLVRLPDQTMRSWGNGWVGQLGDGTTRISNVPGLVVGLASADVPVAGAIDAGVIKTDGTVRTWGYNGWGVLGDGTMTASPSPVTVVEPTDPSGNLTGVTSLALGWENSLASRADGSVLEWGSHNSSLVPLPVVDPSDPSGKLSGVASVAAGEYFSLVAKTNGSVWGWGSNAYGQLGDGTTRSSMTPVQALGLSGVTAVSAGDGGHVLALKGDGSVWAWGNNYSGQLGIGTFVPSSVPVQVTSLSSVSAVSAGDNFSLALLSDGTALSWGNNWQGELGVGTNVYSELPAPVLDPADPTGRLTSVVAIAAGTDHSMALKSDGSIFTWGANLYGSLGQGTWGQSQSPVTPLISTLDDADADGVCDSVDNCPTVVNPRQTNCDADGLGDACDADDSDSDGVLDRSDDCPCIADPLQGNVDGDQFGDACDPCPTDPMNLCVVLNVLRNASVSTRSFATYPSIMTVGGTPVLDDVRDLFAPAVTAGSQQVAGADALPVGDGSAGVVIFYEVTNTAGPLLVRKSGADTILSGW